MLRFSCSILARPIFRGLTRRSFCDPSPLGLPRSMPSFTCNDRRDTVIKDILESRGTSGKRQCSSVHRRSAASNRLPDPAASEVSLTSHDPASHVDTDPDQASARGTYNDYLQHKVYELEFKVLQERRRRLQAQGKLRRLKSRKWWRLAGVLGRWRRSPWRIDRLLVESVHLARDLSPLPALPDTTDLEARLREAADRASGAERGLDDVRALIGEGEYELALSVLEDMSIDTQRSPRGFSLRAKALVALGELSQLVVDLRAQADSTNSAALGRRARTIEGRLIETDTTWLPDVGHEPPSADRPPSHPNRILHLVKESLPFYERGYTIRSHASFLAQRQAGYDPVVATSLNFPREYGFSDFSPVDVIEGIAYNRLDLGSRYEMRQTPYDLQLSDMATALMRLATELRPALLQAGSGYRGYETALTGMAVARGLDIPFVYEMRSFLEHTWTAELSRSESGEYYRRRFAQEVRCLEQADHVITIAETMRQEIIARGIPGNRVTVVPNVVDSKRFAPRPKNQALARRYRIEGKVVLGYISNLGPREGISTLIDAVAIMRRQGHEVMGLVFGDGPEAGALRDHARALGIESSFLLPGHVSNSEIEEHYSLIDVFVVPRIDDRASRWVTPLKPLEAMAMGIPVVASDLPALQEMIAPNERGLTFTAGVPESLAEVAMQLIEDRELSAELSASARAWVESDRSIASNAARYDSVFSKVVG